MTAIVIYFSKFGNTQMIAETIARTLLLSMDAKLTAHDELQSDDLSTADLVVMGSPTHRMNLPEVVRETLKLLPKRALRGKSMAAFDTSYRMSDRNTPAWMARFTAAPKLARKLRRLGGKPIAPPETFFVRDKEGPLYDGELERAADWGSSLLDRMLARDSTKPIRSQAV